MERQNRIWQQIRRRIDLGSLYVFLLSGREICLDNDDIFYRLCFIQPSPMDEFLRLQRNPTRDHVLRVRIIFPDLVQNK